MTSITSKDGYRMAILSAPLFIAAVWMAIPVNDNVDQDPTAEIKDYYKGTLTGKDVDELKWELSDTEDRIDRLRDRLWTIQGDPNPNRAEQEIVEAELEDQQIKEGVIKGEIADKF